MSKERGLVPIDLLAAAELRAELARTRQALREQEENHKQERMLRGSYSSQLRILDGPHSSEWKNHDTLGQGESCPSISVQSNGDGSIWFSFTNVHPEIATLRIVTASETSCAPPLTCCQNQYLSQFPLFALEAGLCRLSAVSSRSTFFGQLATPSFCAAR